MSTSLPRRRAAGQQHRRADRRRAPRRGRRRSSPIPAAAALLARERGGGRPYVSLLGSRRQNFFTDGGRELFDCAGQGRIDVFFLSGGADRRRGQHQPRQHRRLRRSRRCASPARSARPISTIVVPKVILFRLEHTRRTLVEKVDFISAPGASAGQRPSPRRPDARSSPIAACSRSTASGGASARERASRAHASPRSIEHTGFDFDRPARGAGDAGALAARRCACCGRWWRRELAEVYPQFAAKVFGVRQAPDARARRCRPRASGHPYHRVRRGGAGGATSDSQCLTAVPACAGTTACGPQALKGKARETSRSRSDRHRLVRRHPRGDAVALRAGGQAAHLRNPPGPAGRGQGAHQAGDRDARLPGHHQEREHLGGLHLAPRRSRTTTRSRATACKAGKHVLLEKPIALELWEADELITLARRNKLKFTIGYSQRFNTKFAYAKKKITDGTLGKLVSVMVSRHLSPQPRQEDRQAREALAGGDGIHPRPRLRVLAAGAGQAGAASIRRAPTATCSRSTAPTTSCGRP